MLDIILVSRVIKPFTAFYIDRKHLILVTTIQRHGLNYINLLAGPGPNMVLSYIELLFNLVIERVCQTFFHFWVKQIIIECPTVFVI